jgi:hypothetical protein
MKGAAVSQIEATEQDREEILRLHRQWAEANHGLRIPLMQEVFARGDANYLMYNLNGHPYYGLDEKVKLWEHYKREIAVPEPLPVHDDRIEVRGDTAWIAYEGALPVMDIGQEGGGAAEMPTSADLLYFRFRATEIYHRDDGEGNPVWKMWHFHCSPLAPQDEPRPGFNDTFGTRTNPYRGSEAK